MTNMFSLLGTKQIQKEAIITRTYLSFILTKSLKFENIRWEILEIREKEPIWWEWQLLQRLWVTIKQ
jgi:hypothetical protein